MKSFKEFLLESRRIGKMMADLYVHKDYVEQTKIPMDVYSKAEDVLKTKHPEFEFTIVKWNPKTNNISFLFSPDWDETPEPYIKDSFMVTSDGAIKYSKEKSDPQIYHQKWQFVGDDYKGFDVEESKERTKEYQKAIIKVAADKGVETKQISSRIGTKSYWDREIVPHIGK